MNTTNETLRLKAILVLPGAAPPDLSSIADPVRIPVRVVGPADVAAAILAAPPVQQD